MNFRIFLLRSILIILVCFGCANFLEAQVEAKFTISNAEGCSPLFNVQMVDGSNGLISKRTWIFGNGNSNVGNNTEVFASYPNAGDYCVTLIVEDDNNNIDSTTMCDVHVFAHPTAQITSNFAAGCAPLAVQFLDDSQEGSATITDWQWTFGDGGASTQQNPAYTYTATGDYTVTLDVTDVNGCNGSTVIADYIGVSDIPTASFTTSDTLFSCTPPLTVDFTNTSTGAGTLSTRWYFGNNTTSTQENPSHTYANFGIYDVSLVVTDASGCSDSITSGNLVQVSDPLAIFSFDNDTICLGGMVSLTNSSVGGLTYQWDFRDGAGNSTAVNPTYTYTNGGIFDVQLIVQGATTTCIDTVENTIIVDEITPGFTSSPDYNCQVPFVVQYTDTSNSYTPIVDWVWNLGTGDTLTSSSPSVTITNSGIYGDSLTVSSQAGCTATVYRDTSIHVFIITPSISSDVTRGCAPLDVNFLGMVLPGELDSVASWNWNFDDPTSGGNNNSALQNPFHQFVNPGEYEVVLNVTDVSGCNHIVRTTIEVGVPPVIDFSKTVDTSCAMDPIIFTDLSTDPNDVDEWIWQFGEGSTVSQQNPSVLFTDTGYIDLEYIVGYNGCYDTLLQDSVVYIQGPYSFSSFIFDCDSSLVYTFRIDTLLDAHRFYWDFGDGSPLDSVSSLVNHTFPASGDYPVTLTSYNDTTGCEFLNTLTPTARVIQADFSPQQKQNCENILIPFDGTSSQDAIDWSWDFGAGGGLVNSAAMDTTAYSTRGTYAVKLVVEDVNGCLDSTTRAIEIYDPQPEFEADTLIGCVPLIVQFSDLTVGDTTLATWSWDFNGEGIDSVQNPNFIFMTSGQKTVTLNVTDSLGCSSSLVKTAYILPVQPIPSFTVTDATACFGDTTEFTNTSTTESGNALSYSWQFGDGGISAFTDPRHAYTDTGSFTITLTATDAVLGCDSTGTFANSVDVQAIPEAGFHADSTYNGCYPAFVTFTDTTRSNDLTAWQWTFGDGGTSTFQNANHQYTFLGFYDVSLIVTTSYGCSDTIYQDSLIEVDGPLADFEITKDTVCKKEETVFQVTSSLNTDVYDWDFGDGVLGFNAGDTVAHQYNQIGTLFPKLFYSTASGCTQVAEDTVFIHRVLADFSVNDSIGCEKFLNIVFTDESLQADTWNWDFGDGTPGSTSPNPTHLYNNRGLYTVALDITNSATGCVDTFLKEIVVHPLPGLTASDDTLICFGDSINLFAQALTNGDSIYNWVPAAGLSNADIKNPKASPIASTNYVVTVTDTNQCVRSDTISVLVQQIPRLVISEDTAMFQGQIANLNVSSNPSNVSYSWSPEDGLDCIDCPAVIAQPLETTTYTVMVADDNGCFVSEASVMVRITKKYTADVPDAFTPNADGINDIIYVNGLGIKEMKEFKIFNRWGELVFETTDITEGWDGTYKGQPQPVETYTYFVVVETWADEILPGKGHIQLMR